MGSEVAGYRIEALLGRGGTAAVYRAHDARLGRNVALKLLVADLGADERFRERFLQESRLAASLDHPNVIPIYEAGETDGLLYIAMRYVEGTDLEALIAREGALEPARALDILSSVAGALDAAHDRGLVHRDVKPGNVLIALDPTSDPPGDVYLSDFGLTKHVAADLRLTQSGQFVGTAKYVAPEQIAGGPLDGRADQYSLGCVLFECLTGAPPFAGEELMPALWAHLNDAPPSPRSRRPSLPRELDAVFERALAKRAAERYASCRELIVEARRALEQAAAAQATAYDDFAQAEIARLEDARLAALEDKIEADLALGRHVESTAELEALVSRHPLRELLRGQLMLALYRAGRQADALASYADARRILASELGLEPSPRLQGLERAILRQDAALDLPARRGPEPQAPAGAADELKPVTALFADIVGSTALGERLPPEEVKALVGECVTAMSRAVEEHGGTVQAYMGDGICAYFGVPTAHEDDPERAARAALRIVEVVGDYSRDVAEAWDIVGFDVRVGINTGQTAVGTVGSARPQTVATGDATNVAARLQATAEPGTIAVGDATVRRLAHRFRFETLGEVPVKGRSEPVRAARLVGTDDRAKPPPAPLVGRARELARLREVVDGLHAGRGQIALLTGEPGIGKSRLLAELRAIAGDDVVWLEGHTASYGGPPLAPFVDILRAWLGIGEGEAEIAARTKARAKLGSLLGERVGDVLPPLAGLLRLRLPPELERPTRAGDDADGAVVAYVSWLTALARDRPVVLALEDVHWADAATGGLAGELLALTEQMPLLLVLTLAGERGSEGWRLRLRVLDEYAHRAAELPVGPLSDEASAELLRTLLPGALDEATRAELVARAEGNPLYLAELLRALVEGGGVERRHRTWTLSSTAARLLPPALENVLVARIDRLPEGPRALAQVAAAIGRTFPVDVLRRVAGGDVDTDVTALLRASIVREVRRYPELECAFGHGLLQEAALSTLTAARRRELFGRVAAAWEQHFAGSLAEHSERLAHYYAQAGDERKARELLAGARPS